MSSRKKAGIFFMLSPLYLLVVYYLGLYIVAIGTRWTWISRESSVYRIDLLGALYTIGRFFVFIFVCAGCYLLSTKKRANITNKGVDDQKGKGKGKGKGKQVITTRTRSQESLFWYVLVIYGCIVLSGFIIELLLVGLLYRESGFTRWLEIRMTIQMVAYAMIPMVGILFALWFRRLFRRYIIVGCVAFFAWLGLFIVINASQWPNTPTMMLQQLSILYIPYSVVQLGGLGITIALLTKGFSKED